MKSTIKKCDKMNNTLYVARKINKYLDIKNSLLMEKKCYNIDNPGIKSYEYDYEVYNEDLYREPLEYH